MNAVVTYGAPEPQGPCTVCGKPFAQHGSYPTCASHPYTPDENCRHVIGARCAGAECNTKGCVRAIPSAPDTPAPPAAWRYKLCGAGGRLLSDKSPLRDGESPNEFGIYPRGHYDVEPLYAAAGVGVEQQPVASPLRMLTDEESEGAINEARAAVEFGEYAAPSPFLIRKFCKVNGLPPPAPASIPEQEQKK